MVDDPRREAWQYRLEQWEREAARERGETADGELDAGSADAAERAGSTEPTSERPADRTTAGSLAAERAAYVEVVIQQAIRRGEFDDLPGAGKPLPGLGRHDPDWWIRRKIETERLTGLGPPALTLRVESAQLDDRLDRMHREDDVRDALDEFNARVVEARRQLLGGPPVVTPTRDVDAEVEAWWARRERRRLAAQEAERRRAEEEADRRARRRWWRRG
ncbi:DnaJ family domain-containing protein [Agromyces binzhouensis]|uniref:DnaJ family domain-containing protein n=1 Tax=Agromyces binzhouensis TaxID=1817495 RepID=UPI0036315DCB